MCEYIKGNPHDLLDNVGKMIVLDLITRIKVAFDRIHQCPMKVDNLTSHCIRLENRYYSQMKQEYPHLVDFGVENR